MCSLSDSWNTSGHLLQFHVLNSYSRLCSRLHLFYASVGDQMDTNKGHLYAQSRSLEVVFISAHAQNTFSSVKIYKKDEV